MSEGTMDREQVWLAALAGLLHDIGKFTGRAGVGTAIDDKREQKEIGYWHAEHSQTFVDHYVPAKFRAGVGVVRYHHRPGNVPAESVEVQALCKLVRLADWWSAGERTTGMPERSTASHTPLLPVLSRVQLVREPAEEGRWKHRVQACGLSKESLFPVDTEKNPLGDVSAQYEDLWDKVVYPELDAWKGRENWETQSLESYFTTLLALLQKHLTFVPSATPWQADEDDRVIPDVSLFDHLRITAALAACLRAGFSDEEILTFGEQENRPVALLVRGDFSGIQSFIYRITRPDNERTFREAARRLRGRSFYLTLLGEIIAHQLLEWLGLPPSNFLFFGW
jgi:CRISPR-associated protein Csm1